MSNASRAFDDGGEFGHQLADFQTGHVGGDGAELAANFGGRVGLHVEHVYVRRPAVQIDHDYRLLRTSPRRRLSPQLQQVRQRQSAQPERPDLQEPSPAQAAARRAGFGNGEHDFLPGLAFVARAIKRHCQII